METEKLTIATTPDEIRSLLEIRRQGIDWDGDSEVLQETAKRVYKTFGDDKSVRLVHPESGKTISWVDIMRVANTAVSRGDVGPPVEVLQTTNVDIAGSLRALIFPGARCEDGIPWGSTYRDSQSGYIEALTLTKSPAMIHFGPDTAWESMRKTLRSWRHPFTDMVITDQYVMSKRDEYLADLLPQILKSLRANDQRTIPRVTLIESSKRLGSDMLAGSPQELATDDLARLKRLFPDAEWSVVFIDLDRLSPDKGPSQSKRVADFLHGRFVTTNALQIQFDPGLDILTSRRSRRSGQPILKSGRINVAAMLEESGRAVILEYVSALQSFFAGTLASETSVGVAGNLRNNRLLYRYNGVVDESNV